MNDTIARLLRNIGFIGSGILSVAYIITVFILVRGFEANGLLQTTIFGCVNAVIGFLIMQCLKVQGVSYARDLPDNKPILERYYNLQTKDKPLHSIKFFWITSVIKDFFLKAITLGASTIGIIYIIIQGSEDYRLLLFAAVNLLMFICFGLMALEKAYRFFNEQHMPYVKHQLALYGAKETQK